MSWRRGSFLFGKKDKSRKDRPYTPTADRILESKIAALEDDDVAVVAEFDETAESEIKAIEASIGASGARRPPSE